MVKKNKDKIHFPDDIELFEVEDIPVARFTDSKGCMIIAAYDEYPPRPFTFTTVLSEGITISKQEFLKLVPKNVLRKLNYFFKNPY